MLRSLLTEERYLPFLLYCNSGFNKELQLVNAVKRSISRYSRDQKKCLFTGGVLRASVDYMTLAKSAVVFY